MAGKVYAKPGDINIGVFVMATESESGSTCSEQIQTGSTALEFSESVAFAVEEVNKREDLLPNVTLGFYAVDDCALPAMSLAQSLSFLPRSDESCVKKTYGNTTCVREDVVVYPVFGVLAPIYSVTAAPVSFLYRVAKTSIVASSASSDEFSDKKIHPYFFRVIGPDKFQVEAMLHFIADNGWSYVSVVYIEGTYGERALDNIKSLVKNYHICLATWSRVQNNDDTDAVAQNLLRHNKSRVVIAFMDEEPFARLVVSVEKLKATGYFIWIASDSIANSAVETLYSIKDLLIGSFLFSFYAPLVPEFYSYIKQQNILESTNPWFKPNWESLNNCTFEAGTCDPVINTLSMSKLDFQTLATFQMDAVLAFAHAAHKLISGLCPNVTGSKARDCVKRELLYHYLRNLSFTGYSGQVQFDINGDSVGRYVIHQVSNETVRIPSVYEDLKAESQKGIGKREVAFYDKASGNLTYIGAISWSHVKDLNMTSGFSHVVSMSRPVSVCSVPCVAGEYRIQKVPVCCWDCWLCRDNQRIASEGCQDCLDFTWPDPDANYTTCTPIPLTHLDTSSVVSVLQIIFAVLAVFLTLSIAASYVHLRHSRVIKAASKELSHIQILAILIGYVTVICFQTYPTHQMCSVLYFMFCLSFAALYSSLLIKVVRIYRIFKNRSNIGPRFISPTSQVMMTLGLVLIQEIPTEIAIENEEEEEEEEEEERYYRLNVTGSTLLVFSKRWLVLCVYITLTYKPTAKKTQTVPTEKFVELACDLTFPGLVTFLTYNLVLVSLCSVFAFKSRKLPDNFNESRFISMCVSTTLVIWLAFIPTYFTAGREYVRVLLLSVSLILNHTVALVFLFLPKVYAAVYLPDQVARVTGVTTVASTN
ncbi:metabotropic glutamate receptor 3-like [Physella acuta]|uniref:metabotropic glutamate receptor 3-like n=1 Tax=Physella acuta TaxID=109671 RepID=UPI0027DE85B6|nr:metabotropic glutamate receptor 3-like [Physella acuta]